MMLESQEKGVPIRQPATANLMLDSADRNAVYPNPFDFQISRQNSILNGFFSRIGTTEVVLEWAEPNGASLAPVKGAFNGTSSFNVAFEDTFYNVSTALQFVASTINSQTGGDVAVENTPGGVALVSPTATNFAFSNDQGAKQIGVVDPGSAPEHFINGPDLRPYRYLDFVSQQLTYNQDLKDSSTAPLVKDVLCRWYMAWDNPPSYDELGFPVLQGYTEFVERRLFNPPKQIKWNPNQPLGNVAFQVYGNNEQAPLQPFIPTGGNTNWLMTLQVSET